MNPMLVFQDVPVVPVTRVIRVKGNGGPAWPDFDRQVTARFCRNGVPSDWKPEVPVRMQPVAGSAVWGGFLVPQFGHLAAESVTRLPQSLHERPDDLYLFTVPPGGSAGTVPGYAWAVLDWMGLPRTQVHIVTEPVMIRELRVAPQGEMLGKLPTDPAYLDLLDVIARKRLPAVRATGTVFVTRSGMVAKGQGGHAGEGYLAAALAQAGVRVMDPGQVSLRDQMAAYAGAETLVFSEGSALHGRCLLGRLPQDIHVLRRRSRRDTARLQLQARCQTLSYVEALTDSLGAARRGLHSRPHLAVALYDLDQVFRLFSRIGIDLSRHWDGAAYRDAIRQDIESWMVRAQLSPEQRDRNLRLLRRHRLLVDPVPATPAAPAATATPT